MQQRRGRWSAQGLEFDYAVDGGSLEDVTHEFAHGLTLTIDDNIRVFGHMRHVLKVAPSDAWTEFFEDTLQEKFEVTLSQFSIHRIPIQVYMEKAA